MKQSRSHRICALRILMPLLALASGGAYAGDSPKADTAYRSVVPDRSPHPANAARTSLNLRAPQLQRVMSDSQLLAEMGSGDEEELIEVLASPALMPMSSDAEAPLGIIDSFHWSIGHPTQTWRILLPATVTP